MKADKINIFGSKNFQKMSLNHENFSKFVLKSCVLMKYWEAGGIKMSLNREMSLNRVSLNREISVIYFQKYFLEYKFTQGCKKLILYQKFIFFLKFGIFEFSGHPILKNF